MCSSGLCGENMFNESWPWKRDLAAAADRLKQARLGLPVILDKVEDSNVDEGDKCDVETEALYLVERDLMNVAFAVRRPIGMPSKVTEQTRESKATVVHLLLRTGARAPDICDALGDLEMYDLQAPVDAVVTANEVCNLFVHSFVLCFAWTLQGLSVSDWWSLDENDARTEQPPGELAGWLIASDRSSTHHLTLVPLPEIVRGMRVFAGDAVAQLVGHRDSRGCMHYTAS